jgi:hypothetical protein
MRLSRTAAALSGAGAAVVAVAIAASSTALTASAERDAMSVVAVRDGKTAPCPEVVVRKRRVHGGCRIKLRERVTGFTALTLFGDNALAKCSMSFTMAIGPSGQLAVEPIEIISLDALLGGACGDIMQCRVDFKGLQPWTRRVPWRGRLVKRPNGAIVAEIDVCLDSCLGRLEGKTEFSLSNSDKGLRLRATDSAVGVSGLELDGVWRPSPQRQAGIRIITR